MILYARKKILWLIIILCLSFSFIFFMALFDVDINKKNIFAIGFDDQINNYDFNDLDSVINFNLDYDLKKNIKKIDLKDLTKEIISGEFDFIDINKINKFISHIFFRDIKKNIELARNLFLLIILASLIKNLSQAFNSKNITEIAFYISYIIIIINLFSAFKICVGIAQNFLDTLKQVIQASLPIIISLIAMTGNICSSNIFNPVIFLICDLIILLIDFLLPFINIFVIVQIINNITNKNLIAKFAELIKILISWSLKIIAIFFMAILSFKRVTAPLLESFLAKSTKFAINLIPFVGEAFTGAIDSIISWAYLIKNGALVAIIISIFFLCMGPIINLISFVLVYKIFAALIEPISDKRIINCLESISSACILLLSCCFCAVIIFLFAIIIFISV